MSVRGVMISLRICKVIVHETETHRRAFNKMESQMLWSIPIKGKVDGV